MGRAVQLSSVLQLRPYVTFLPSCVSSTSTFGPFIRTCSNVLAWRFVCAQLLASLFSWIFLEFMHLNLGSPYASGPQFRPWISKYFLPKLSCCRPRFFSQVLYFIMQSFQSKTLLSRNSIGSSKSIHENTSVIEYPIVNESHEVFLIEYFASSFWIELIL